MFVKNGSVYSDQGIRDTIPAVFSRFTNQNILISEYRHISQAFLETIQGNIPSSSVHSYSQQAGHSQQTAASNYAISAENPHQGNAKTFEFFENASIVWQRFLGIIPNIASTQKVKESLSMLSSVTEESIMASAMQLMRRAVENAFNTTVETQTGTFSSPFKDYIYNRKSISVPSLKQ